MTNTNDILGAFLPSIESWMRGIVADEVKKAIERENDRKKPVRTYTRQEVADMAKISLPTLLKRVADGYIAIISHSCQ